MTGVFSDIRIAAAAVAAGSIHVRVNEALIPAYAADLPQDLLASPSLDPATHYLDGGEGTAAFVLALDAINFGSGWFPRIRKRPGLSGYFTVAAGLTDRFRAGGVPSPDDLATLTPETCALWFGQDQGNPDAMALMTLFARALSDLGRLVIEAYDGRYAGLIEAADGSAEHLVSILRKMPFYDDVAMLDGHSVPFLKRAQLTVADLALAFGGEGWGRFDDLGQLTMFADNLVPHVLRLDGVLGCDPALAARIDAEELIEAGSRAEIELRACALHTVERMVTALAVQGRPTSAMHVDYLLWNRGQLPRYKQAKPRHRTRTVYY